MVYASSCIGFSLGHSFGRALAMAAVLSAMDTLGLIRTSTLKRIHLNIFDGKRIFNVVITRLFICKHPIPDNLAYSCTDDQN